MAEQCFPDAPGNDAIALWGSQRREPRLDNMSPATVRRFHAATLLLRATELALQDDGLAALAIADGCGLAVALADLLAAVEESEEADALFFHTLKAAAIAGLYQVFSERRPGPGERLRRPYARAAAAASTDRDVLPFIGGAFSRHDARHAAGASEPSRRHGNDTLTARERAVLSMISQGLSNKRIARTLGISPETVKSHVKHVFSKLSVTTRTAAASRAGSLGLL